MNGIKTHLSSTHTGSAVPASDTLKDQTWTVRVTPTDGIVNGDDIETSLVISNTPPVMTSVTVAPTAPTTLDDITLAIQRRM